MTPLRGHNVYSADGTRYAGKVVWAHRAFRLGFLVRLVQTQRFGWQAYAHVLEWDRALGGWLAL